MKIRGHSFPQGPGASGPFLFVALQSQVDILRNKYPAY